METPVVLPPDSLPPGSLVGSWRPWARLKPRSSREVMRVLAQAASALAAVHAASGLHRDVKGDNLLVRPEDGHVVLLDFGSCTFRGAPVLTRQSEPPGTPHYQSPQAQLHQWKFRRHPATRYEASAADDVYALGVTAYRLTTGRYPLIAEETGPEGLEDAFSRFPELVPADALVRLSPELTRWIRQMLSVQPEARGAATELTLGLELSANSEGAVADLPVGPPGDSQPAVTAASPPPAQQPLPCEEAAPPLATRPALLWHVWLIATTVGIVLLALGGGVLHALLEQSPSALPGEHAQAAPAPAEEGETSGLGEVTLPELLSPPEPLPVHEGVNAPVPAQPLPGQRLPPCKRPLVEINGGCWFPIDEELPCSEFTYEWRKRCYAPAPEGPSRPRNTKER